MYVGETHPEETELMDLRSEESGEPWGRLVQVQREHRLTMNYTATWPPLIPRRITPILLFSNCSCATTAESSLFLVSLIWSSCHIQSRT